MKIENCPPASSCEASRAGKLKISNSAFTLIELLVAMAIIALLVAVVLVQFQGYAKGARASKALGQLSSVIPGMVSCWGNGGKVKVPTQNGGADICTLNPSYGKWPSFTSDMDSYDFTVSVENVSTDPDYCMTGCIDKDAWYFYVNSVGDNKRICCNKTVGGCASKIKASGTTCNATEWTD